MARTPTTADAFNAVAEASRRELLDALGTGEATVGELVDRLGLQPVKLDDVPPEITADDLGVVCWMAVLQGADGRH